MERGYSGFHFRVLAEKLGIGRSTIYEYYTNKEELILAYMNQLMGKVMRECKSWENQVPLERMKGYLSVFMQYDQIHHMIQILPMIDRSNSSIEVEKEIQKLFYDHQKVYAWITNAIDEAKEREEIRKDLPTQLLAAIIFSSVQLPKLMTEEIKEIISGEMIFDLLHKGFHT